MDKWPSTIAMDPIEYTLGKKRFSKRNKSMLDTCNLIHQAIQRTIDLNRIPCARKSQKVAHKGIIVECLLDKQCRVEAKGSSGLTTQVTNPLSLISTDIMFLESPYS